MREVMRIGTLFETWSCANIDFDQLCEVWPYYLGDNFGATCLSMKSAQDLASFTAFDCLLVALRLRLPVRTISDLPVPVDLRAKNPVSDSSFASFRVQSVRASADGKEVTSFTCSDDPFSDAFGSVFFGFYGIGNDGLSEHIADRNSLEDALELAEKLAPGIEFISISRCLNPQTDNAC